MESQPRMPKRVRRDVLQIGGDRHEDGGLINLPTEILHNIMLHVSVNLKDHFNAIAAIRTLRRVTDDESFLRGLDLFEIDVPWVPNVDGSLNKFLIRCHHAGNMSALFLQGCAQFFHKHDLENGLAMIREAALSGYELAIYFYSNLMRILNNELLIDVDLVNPSRDLVRRMRRKVETSLHNFWAPDPVPPLYLERCDAFDYSIIRRCHCSWNEPWEREWVESVKDPWMCDLCFYSIHVLGFIRLIPHKIRKWPMDYEF